MDQSRRRNQSIQYDDYGNTSIENELTRTIVEGNPNQERQRLSVDIDYHVKDVLDDNALGIITRNRDDAGTTAENDFASALHVVMLVITNVDIFQQVYNSIYERSRNSYDWDEMVGSRIYDGPAELMLYLQYLRNNRSDVYIHTIPAKPEELNYTVVNSAYQEYDTNNNIINVIPYSKKVIVNETDFLGIITFTLFDFHSLSLRTPAPLADEMSPQAVFNALNNLTGELNAEVVIQDGRVTSEAKLYRELNGNPYYGHVHRMRDGRIMSGIIHSDGGRELIETTVPVTKIQDFRTVQRSKMVNYQPAVLESYGDKIPSITNIQKNNKDYFDLENVSIELDRRFRWTDLQFTVNMADIYRFNSRYYQYVKTLAPEIQELFLASIDIGSIEILRKRVTKYEIRNNRLGSPKRVDFDQQELPIDIVAKSGQPLGAVVEEPRPIIGRFTLDNDGRWTGFVSEVDFDDIVNDAGLIDDISLEEGRERYYRSFQAKDFSIGKLFATDGVYQYGVRIRAYDNSANIIEAFLQVAKKQVTILKRYLEECQVPVFDTRKVKRISEDISTSANIFDLPVFDGVDGTVGNYDTSTNKFTEEFVNYAMQKYFTESEFREGQLEEYITETYSLEQIAEYYNLLVQLVFGKSHAELSRGSLYSMPSEENGILQSSSTYEKMQKGEAFDRRSAERVIVNMINPENSRPELIQSFVRSYEDMILEIQQHFSFPENGDTLSASKSVGSRVGAGNLMDVQRWFSGVDVAEEEDHYVHLDSTIDKEIFFEYDLGEWSPDAPRMIKRDEFTDIILKQSNAFAANAADIASLVPTSIVIGRDIIHFNKDYEQLDAIRKLEQKYARELPYYIPKRVVSINPGLFSLTNPPTTLTSPTIKKDTIQYSKEDCLSSINHFITTVSTLSNDEAKSAIASMNKFATTDFKVPGKNENYFLFMDSIREKYEKNNVDYGPEIFKFSTLIAPKPQTTTFECEGIVLQDKIEDDPVEDLAEQYYREQSTTPEVTYTKRQRKPKIKIPLIMPGLTFDQVKKVLSEDRGPLLKYVVPPLRIPVITNIPTIPSGIVTFEKSAPKYIANRLPAEITVGNLSKASSIKETLTLSSKRVAKDLSLGKGPGIKIKPAISKIKIQPRKSSKSVSRKNPPRSKLARWTKSKTQKRGKFEGVTPRMPTTASRVQSRTPTVSRTSASAVQRRAGAATANRFTAAVTRTMNARASRASRTRFGY